MTPQRGHAKGTLSIEDGRKQARAHRAVSKAIQERKLVRPKVCEGCGEEPGHDVGGRSKIVAHHHNGYENQLDVQWLCQRCNIRLGFLLDPREPVQPEPTKNILDGGSFSCPEKRLRNLVWYGKPGYEAETARVDMAIAENEELNRRLGYR
jgi:hypothetical protein